MPRRRKKPKPRTAGRPPVDDPRTERRVYLNEKEWALVEKAAALAAKDQTEYRRTGVWMRRALVYHAKKTIRAAKRALKGEADAK